MNDFRVNVTPEQSKIVQETLFKLGYKWYSGITDVSHTSEPVLCISPIDKDITYSSYSIDSNMTYEKFKEEFVKFKLPEKWCVKGSNSKENTIIRKWFYDNQKTKGFFTFDFVIGVYYLSDNLIKTSWTNQGFYFPEGYTEITFEQFVKHILKQKTMGEELKVTKEYVLELAKLYPETKDKLKVLFPKAFEYDKYFKIPLKYNNRRQVIVTEYGGDVIWVKQDYEFAEKGFYLNEGLNWEIVKDSDGALVLVPTKKQ